MICEHCGGPIGEREPRVRNLETGVAFHAYLDGIRPGPCYAEWLRRLEDRLGRHD